MNKKIISSAFMVVVGTFLYALTVKLFLEPSGLVTGGTTGIGLALNRTLGFPLAASILVINGSLLLWAYFDLGKAFVAQTIASTLAFPFCLQIIEYFASDVVLTQDIFLCTVFSGIGIGVSLGIVIHAGASTGGADIPPLSLNKHFGIPVALTLNIIDFIIIAGQAFFMPLNSVLYGVVLVICYTFFLDYVLMLGQRKTQITIVSPKADIIKEQLLDVLDHGVTVFHGEGGYLKEKYHILVSVVSSRDLPKIERLVQKIDPTSFITVSQINLVKGRGFSLNKKHRTKPII